MKNGNKIKQYEDYLMAHNGWVARNIASQGCSKEEPPTLANYCLTDSEVEQILKGGK